MLGGDFGNSRLHARPVLDVMGPFLVNSVNLMVLSFVLSLAIALPARNTSSPLHVVYGSEGCFARGKLPAVSAFHTLLMKDIPARFPKLRWGFIEVSSQWLP